MATSCDTCTLLGTTAHRTLPSTAKQLCVMIRPSHEATRARRITPRFCARIQCFENRGRPAAGRSPPGINGAMRDVSVSHRRNGWLRYSLAEGAARDRAGGGVRLGDRGASGGHQAGEALQARMAWAPDRRRCPVWCVPTRATWPLRTASPAGVETAGRSARAALRP
jgi:hypothetical protein